MDPHVKNYEKYIYAATSQEIITPLTQYISRPTTIMRNIKLVGDKSGRKYWMMTEKAKLLIRSLLKALRHFHINGVCLLHFNESNVVVTISGRVKLKDIHIQGKNDSFILDNYRDARAILLTTMFTSTSVIPEDINHLLELMNSGWAIHMDYVISTHASLVPLGNRFQFFYKMYEQITSVLNNTREKTRILDALPYLCDWHTRLQSNALLEESFRGGYTSYDPNGGPIVFLQFYRNALAHRMERCLKPLKNNPHIRPLKYTQDDFEKILVVTYPEYLPKIQEELENENQLRALNLHDLF